MRDSLKKMQSASSDSARSLAVSALTFIAADPDRLTRYLGITGLGPDNLRSAAADPAFLSSVLDYLVAADGRPYLAQAAVGKISSLRRRARKANAP
jgi:hypothetical protein